MASSSRRVWIERAALVGVALGALWLVTLREPPARPGPPLEPTSDAISRRWASLKLAVVGPLEGRLFPRYRREGTAVGGVGRAGLFVYENVRRGEGAGLVLGMDPARVTPVPEDAREELARRDDEVLAHLYRAKVDLLVRGPAGARRFFRRSEAGWDPLGSFAALARPGVQVGLVLAEETDQVAAVAALRERGVGVCFLVAPREADVVERPPGIDAVLYPDPRFTRARPDWRHVPVVTGGLAGVALEVLVPRAGAPRGLRTFAELGQLIRRWDRVAGRDQVLTGAAGRRAQAHLRSTLRAEVEALAQDAFLREVTRPLRPPLSRNDPSEIAQRAHLEQDRERYPPSGSRFRSSVHPGGEACASCHPAEAQAWRGTAHALAFQGLQDRGAQRSPACVTCHTTGFQFPGGPPGWTRMDQWGASEGVGCTACHRPEAAPSRPAHPWGRARGCLDCHRTVEDPAFRHERTRRFQQVSCQVLVARARREAARPPSPGPATPPPSPATPPLPPEPGRDESAPTSRPLGGVSTSGP